MRLPECGGPEASGTQDFCWLHTGQKILSVGKGAGRGKWFFYTVLWGQKHTFVYILEAISDQWNGFPAGHSSPAHPVLCKLLGLRSGSFTGNPHRPAHCKCFSTTGWIVTNVPLPSRPTESIGTSSVLAWHATPALWAWKPVRQTSGKKPRRHFTKPWRGRSGNPLLTLLPHIWGRCLLQVMLG